MDVPGRMYDGQIVQLWERRQGEKVVEIFSIQQHPDASRVPRDKIRRKKP